MLFQVLGLRMHDIGFLASGLGVHEGTHVYT